IPQCAKADAAQPACCSHLISGNCCGNSGVALCTMKYSLPVRDSYVGKEKIVVVLVIGGAGYIGSHATRALKRAGHEVIIFDNLCTGYEIRGAGFELVKSDVLDSAALARVLPRATAVMHFAAHAYVGESVTNPRKYF